MSLPAASEDTRAVMKTWTQDKPVVGLMGEFSSGKSTLLNFLIAQDVATTKVTATPLPPIWFTHSDTPFSQGLRDDGTVEDVDTSDPDINFRGTYLAIRRGVNSETLKRCDIIDAPGISDPDLGKNALRFLQSYFDFVIWCTGASQAWRQTDKAAFEKLAKTTQTNSILVVTRIDKLRTLKDREKVLKRVTSETRDLFSDVVGLQTTKAAAVPLHERDENPANAWVKTGAFGFLAAFDCSLSKVHPKAIKAAKTKTTGSADNLHKNSAKTGQGAAKIDSAEAQEVNPADALIKSLEAIRIKPENDPYCLQIDHLIASIKSDHTNQKHGAMMPHVCSQVDSDELETERLISQIERERLAFRNGGRIRLDI